MKKMKKSAALVLCLILALGLLPVTGAPALALTEGDWTYTVADGEATVTGYSGSETAISIPSSLGGYPVTALGAIILSRATSLTLPASVTNVGSAIMAWRALTSITVSGSNPVYSSIDGVLFSKDKTTLIRCPAGRSGSYTIPSGVTHIGDNAFGTCTLLESITIPNGVTSIGEGAFSDCFVLPNITIPASVTSIGNAPFSACSMLSAIAVDGKNPNYRSVDGVLFSRDMTALIQYPGGKAGSYAIPEGVTSIRGAFTGCDGLTGVTVPASVTADGIADVSFAPFECKNLTAITVDGNNPDYCDIDGVLFSKDRTTLVRYPGGRGGSYAIPAGVTSIGVSAFSASYGLTEISIPRSVTSISPRAFTACYGLTSVTIPDKMTCIRGGCFEGCFSLTTVRIPAGVTSIEVGAFRGCPLEDVYYGGTREQWQNVEIGRFNDELSGAAVHFFGPPTMTASYASGKVTVKWNAVEGATKYTVYRRAYSGSWSSWEAVKTNLTGTSWSDTGITAGTEYQYRMRAYNGAWSDYSAAVNVKTAIPKPAAPTVTASYASGKVTVKWNAVSGATKYALYRRAYTGSWSSWAAVSTSLTGTSYTDGAVTPGTTYQYRMKAYNGTWSDYSAAAEVNVVNKPAAPTFTVSYEDGAMHVAWTAVSGAKKYALYRSCYKNGAWTGWTAVNTKLTGTSCTDPGVEEGYRYQYRMKAYNGLWSDYTPVVNVYSVSVPPAAPVISASAGSGKITVTWDSVDGGIKYAVYRCAYENGKWGKWSALNTTIKGANTSYEDKTAQAGVKYQYRMKAFNGLWSVYSNTVTVTGK